MNAELWGVIIVFGLIGYWLIGYLFDRRKGPRPRAPSAGADGAARSPAAVDVGRRAWYHVLEVPPDASLEQIEYAYRRLVSQYHPDKVAALGPELRAVAERMTTELNLAYAAARKARA